MQTRYRPAHRRATSWCPQPAGRTSWVDINAWRALSPNSGRRLLQLALIRTTDERLYLQTAEFEGLPLLYSWTCDIHRGEFTYRVDQREIEILAYEAGTTLYTKFPSKDYPDSFAPVTMNLVPITESEQKTISELNDRETRLESESAYAGCDLDRPQHQLGGIPGRCKQRFPSECARDARVRCHSLPR